MTNAMLHSGLFGALFQDAEIAQCFSARAMLGRMMAFETAWTEALAAYGAVSGDDMTEALAALRRFETADYSPQSDRDGLPLPAFVARLREGLTPGAARAIHTGATSQDVIDTAMVLTGLPVLEVFEARILRLLATLERLEVRFGAMPLMARTRMQAALPATVALRLGGYGGAGSRRSATGSPGCGPSWHRCRSAERSGCGICPMAWPRRSRRVWSCGSGQSGMRIVLL